MDVPDIAQHRMELVGGEGRHVVVPEGVGGGLLTETCTVYRVLLVECQIHVRV